MQTRRIVSSDRQKTHPSTKRIQIEGPHGEKEERKPKEEKRLVESLFANILIWKSSFCGKDPLL